jgi:hypothetical protein
MPPLNRFDILMFTIAQIVIKNFLIDLLFYKLIKIGIKISKNFDT